MTCSTLGLVELIVLNIAYSAHVFSPTLYTMLVVMALVTTAMTVPILNRLGIETSQRYAELEAQEVNFAHPIRFSGNPD